MLEQGAPIIQKMQGNPYEEINLLQLKTTDIENQIKFIEERMKSFVSLTVEEIVNQKSKNQFSTVSSNIDILQREIGSLK